MGSVWAIMRHTFAQCLRMRVAATFVFMLAAILGALPLIMKGDGTLAGQIRTFLSYSTSMTGFLLTIVTVFVSSSVISSDVQNKQIFSLDTKPLARWQYVIGRWAGIVLMNAVFLLVAMGLIYGFAQYLRQGQAAGPNDRRAVESEVFVARRQVAPDAPDIAGAVGGRIRKMMESGDYKVAMDVYRARTNGDELAARQMMEEELASQYIQALQSAGPGRGILWTFSGIQPVTTPVRGTGRVIQWFVMVSARIHADPQLVAQLVPGGPVQINGLLAAVRDLGADSFVAEFPARDIARLEQGKFHEGQDVEIVIEPSVQISYKLANAGGNRDDTFTGLWVIENPRDRFVYEESRTDAGKTRSTLTVPIRAISSEGQLRVRYFNASPFSVELASKDIAVLYRVGGFEGNLVRAILLIQLQLMYVAALGILFGCFLSFPVASMACFSLLPFGLARDFLADAVRPIIAEDMDAELSVTIGRYAFNVMKHLIPDLESTSPAGRLVEGQYISWAFMGQAAFWTFVVGTLSLLLISWLIFRKRELAWVQV